MACRDRPVVADAHPPPPFEPAQQTPSSSPLIIQVDSPDSTPDLIELSSTTPDHLYAASASDTAPTRGFCPKRRPSRQHRRFRRRVFNATRQERLESLPATTSDEEALPTFLKEGSVNPAFFRALPRPSDIVPAIEDGSASDAGYNTAEREAHNRRKAATVVGIDALNKDGTLSAITNWKKSMYNLQAYSDFLDPPPTDMQLPKVRVPPQLMTSYYRGVFLKRKQIWQKRKRRKFSDHSSIASGERLEFRDPQSTSASDWSDDDNEENSPSPSTQNQDAASEEDMPPGIMRDPHGANSWQMSTPFSKVKFLEYINRCIAESDGPTPAEMLHISTHPFAAPQPRRQFSVPHLKQKTRPTNTNIPAPRPEVSHFKNFLSRMQESSSFLFQPVNPADYQPPVTQAEDEPKEENLPPFEKEKKLAMEFCGEKPDYLAKKFRKIVEKGSNSVPSVKLEHQLSPQKNDRINPLPLKMMKKMGFKDRLGAKEDGKIEPVLAVPQGFRTGLGVKPSVELQSGAARLLPAGGAQRSSRDALAQTNKDAMKKGRVNLVSLKMMKKMGFKGRLGANEDGRSEPIFATQQGFRQGIGAAPTVTLNSGGVSLFSAEYPEEYSKKFRGDAAGTNVKTEPNTAKPATLSREKKRRQVFKPKYVVKRRLITRKPVEKYVDSIALADNRNSDTEMQNAGHRKGDSGRKAILVDFDSLLVGGRGRRLDAFRVLRKAFSVKENPKFDTIILGDDLSDADAIDLLLGDKSDHQKRDLAFSVLELEFKKRPPVLDKNLLETLRQQKAHFGILHRGSEKRMRYEIELLEVNESFLQGPARVTNDDEWPYLKTWNNLRTEVGTPAAQTLLVGKTLQENIPSKHQPGQLRLVGSYFNSMVGLMSETNSMMIYAPGEHEARIWKVGQGSIADVSLPPAMPCRKIAFYPDDALWFAADSFFHDVLGKRFWIEFRGLGKRDWVEERNIESLSKQNYALFKKKRFPGILDVDDVDLLE